MKVFIPAYFITSGHSVQKWKGTDMESMRDTKRIMEREIKKGSIPLSFEQMEIDTNNYQEITSVEKLTQVLQYLHRVGNYKSLAGKTVINNVYTFMRGRTPDFTRARSIFDREKIYHQMLRQERKMKPTYLLVHDRGVVCGNDIGDAITADRRQRVVDRLTILIIADFMNRKQRVADVALQSICAVALRSLSVDFEDGMIRPDMIALIHHLVERAIFRKCRDEVREAGILDVDLIDRDRFVILPDQTLDVDDLRPHRNHQLLCDILIRVQERCLDDIVSGRVSKARQTFLEAAGLIQIQLVLLEIDEGALSLDLIDISLIG